ncbi:hypothetical protein E2N92_11140 [Methanofollis formosanus]|uniref:Uncharacterized protein n=1 Tax=Methanofollis formosanus TaxID=299308 RepID=A0A8G1EHF3_9EURY|nr:hypothetical protein [Methanofollis formosanus]QYZ79937.1 hypothetical protein E2N92_11140 [Methanofollis formosanus]
MSKFTALLIIGLLVAVFFFIVPVSAAVQTPLPGQGNQTLILYGIHPNAQKNETIRTFIEEHGKIEWGEYGRNRTHRYVCIIPVNASEKKLFYLNNQTAEHNQEPSIVFVRIIDRDEPLPIPTPDRDPFRGLYQKYPVLKEDEDVQTYIAAHSPERYKEEPTGTSRSRVYFIDEEGTFSEYIVDLEDGNIVSGRYLSEDQLTVNRSEAIEQALGRQPEDARIESALLTIHDDDIYWEIAILNGPMMEYALIPVEKTTSTPHPTTESPGFASCLALGGIGVVLVLSRTRR